MYLHEFTKCVDFKDVRSSSVQISTGVPQGSILGSLLFISYVNDLPSEAPNTDIIMFADDTTALFHGKHFNGKHTNDIYDNIDVINRYTQINRFVPHPDKTKTIIFSKRSQLTFNEDRVQLKLAPDKITYAESYKCLGFTLDQHLTYTLEAMKSQSPRQTGRVRKLNDE